MFTMRHFNILWLFILWLNMDESLQQNASPCNRKTIPNTIIDNDKPVYRHGEIAEYACINGYTGRFFLKCERNNWIGQPYCDGMEIIGYKATCNRKDYPNAEIDGNIREVYHYKDVVHYVCKGNYEGRFSLTCEQQGWAGSPQCTECKKPHLEHGFVVGPFNNTLYYTCDENYKFETQGWWGQAQCGSEEIELAKCIDKNNCGKPPAIPNMRATSPRNNYEHGQTISIICKEGFTAQIEQLTCLKGNWNLNETSLETICVSNGTTCSVPPQVGNAVIESSPQKVYLSGTELKYRCRDDYTMEGNAIITCNNGKWDERIISCAQNCIFTGIQPNVYLHTYVPGNQLTKGQKLMFSCLPGQILGGSPEVECLENGQWSHPFPTCRAPLNCGTPPPLANGGILGPFQQEYRHSAWVEYGCQYFYRMQGVRFRRCLDGKWIGEMRCLLV